MNRFALLTFYRSLVRHKLYAALNIGGLAVGIAVFLVLGLYVRFETSWEKWLPNYGHVYLIETKDVRLDQRHSQSEQPDRLVVGGREGPARLRSARG